MAYRRRFARNTVTYRLPSPRLTRAPRPTLRQEASPTIHPNLCYNKLRHCNSTRLSVTLTPNINLGPFSHNQGRTSNRSFSLRLKTAAGSAVPQRRNSTSYPHHRPRLPERQSTRQRRRPQYHETDSTIRPTNDLSHLYISVTSPTINRPSTGPPHSTVDPKDTDFNDKTKTDYEKQTDTR